MYTSMGSAAHLREQRYARSRFGKHEPKLWVEFSLIVGLRINCSSPFFHSPVPFTQRSFMFLKPSVYM